MSFYQDDMLTGYVLLATTSDPNASSFEYAFWLYADRNTVIKGQCSNETFELFLKTGWNRATLKGTKLSELEFEFEYTTGAVPSNAQWHLFKDEDVPEIRAPSAFLR